MPPARIVRILLAASLFNRSTRPKPQLLLVTRDITFGFGKVERIVGIDLQRDRIIRGTQVMAVTFVKETRAHANELRQVLVQRSESIVDPGADRGNSRIKHVTPGMKLNLGSVIVVGGPHGSNDRDVIDSRTDVRKPVADFDPALAALFVADLQRIESCCVVDHWHR